jgi:hypothetical protein
MPLAGVVATSAFPVPSTRCRGYGSSIDDVLMGTIGEESYPRTAVPVHEVHDTNRMFEISEGALRTMIRAVMQNGIGGTFLNAVAYTQLRMIQ